MRPQGGARYSSSSENNPIWLNVNETKSENASISEIVGAWFSSSTKSGSRIDKYFNARLRTENR